MLHSNPFVSPSPSPLPFLPMMPMPRMFLGVLDTAMPRHLHALRLTLVSLGVGGVVAGSQGDFAVLLDERAARAEVGRLEVRRGIALDAVFLTNPGTRGRVVA